MKSEFEQHDREAIAREVVEMLSPLLNRNGRIESETIIFNVQSLSKYLQVSPKWIYKRVQFKEIPHIKVNGLLRFKKRDIDKWLTSYNIPAVSTPERVLKAIK